MFIHPSSTLMEAFPTANILPLSASVSVCEGGEESLTRIKLLFLSWVRVRERQRERADGQLEGAEGIIHPSVGSLSPSYLCLVLTAFWSTALVQKECVCGQNKALQWFPIL